MVIEQFSDAVCVDYLAPKENRRVNGIPIDEFKSESKYRKLPKGWNYDTRLFEITCDDMESYKATARVDLTNPDNITELYEKGLLVEKAKIFYGIIDTEITNQGYRIIKTFERWARHSPNSISIRPDRLYTTYTEAKAEVDANIAEFIRQSNLTDEEWSIEQIDKTLNRWQAFYNIDEKEKQRYRDWLLEMDNVVDIETRLYGGDIQWKYCKNKRWNNIEL